MQAPAVAPETPSRTPQIFETAEVGLPERLRAPAGLADPLSKSPSDSGRAGQSLPPPASGRADTIELSSETVEVIASEKRAKRRPLVQRNRPLPPPPPAYDREAAPSPAPRKSADDEFMLSAPDPEADDEVAPSAPGREDDDEVAPSAPGREADDEVAPSAPGRKADDEVAPSASVPEAESVPAVSRTADDKDAPGSSVPSDGVVSTPRRPTEDARASAVDAPAKAGDAREPSAKSSSVTQPRSPTSPTANRASRRRAEAAFELSAPTTVAERGPAYGGLVVLGETSTARRTLRARAARAVGWVDGVRARTVIDFVFDVAPKAAEQVTFLYTLPADAVVAGFSVYERPKDPTALFRGPGPLPRLPKGYLSPEQVRDEGVRAAWGPRRDGVVDVRMAAAETAEDAVRRRSAASTVAWAGGRQVRIDIYPAPLGKPLRVVLAYEETLAVDDRGRAGYQIRLPKDAKIRRTTVFASEQARPVSPSTRGRWRPADRWRRQDRSRASASSRWSFDVGSDPVVVRGPDADGLQGDFFFVRYPLPASRAREGVTGDAIVALDISRRSDDQGAAARQVELLERILASDPTIERYAVLLYDVTARWLHRPGWRLNDSERRRETLQTLRTVDRDGGSDPSAAIEAVLKAKWINAPAAAFLLTTGGRTWGAEDRTAAQKARGGDAHWWVYSLDGGTTDDELAALAAPDDVTSVASRDALAAAATRHRAGPAAVVQIEMPGASDLVGVPGKAYPGQVLHFAGRLPSGGAAEATVRWGGVPVATFSIDGGRSPLAARAWAQVALTTWRRDGWAPQTWAPLAEWFRLMPPGLAMTTSSARPRPRPDAIETLSQRVAGSEPARPVPLPPTLQRLAWRLRQLTDRTSPIRPTRLERPGAWRPGARRSAAELQYRRDRVRRPRDFSVYRAIVRARVADGDRPGAIRALSTLLATAPEDPAVMRVVGYALLAIDEGAEAAALFDRLRRRRPFEAQAWLEAGLAFEAAGRPDIALTYYGRVWTGRWDQASRASRTVAAVYLRRLLQVQLPQLDSLGASMIAQLDDWLGDDAPRGSLTYAAHWSVPVDLDLVVFGPDGLRCEATRCAKTAGRIPFNVRAAPGPELFIAPPEWRGPIDALMSYRENTQPKTTAPVAVLLIADRSDGLRHYTVRLLPTVAALAMIRSDQM